MMTLDENSPKLVNVKFTAIHPIEVDIFHLNPQMSINVYVALEKCHKLNDPNQLHPHWLFFLLCVIHCDQNCSQNQPPTAHPRLQQYGRKSIKVTHSHTHTHTHTQPGWLPQYLSEHLSNGCSISNHETIVTDTLSGSSGLWNSVASMLTSNCPQNREGEKEGEMESYTGMS